MDPALLAWGKWFCISYLGTAETGFPAKDALDAVLGVEGKRVRARLLALAQRMADHGHLTREHGHWLESPYKEIYEFKPYAFRVFAFLDGKHLRVVSVAKKAKPRRQERDYDHANNLRTQWLAAKKPKENR
ncbi:MAG: hypothetical protein JWL61_5446 [Gemmatimonadetes bacterium]|nr:hypothetical protein [Gemmatimonadota bacterium]